MQINGFRDMYLAELKELCSTEAQLGQALARAAGAASNPDLKSTLSRHRDETEEQKKRLEALLKGHGASGGHIDQAMEALLQETEKMTTMLPGSELRDVGLIASVQKIEHYEIAACGTAAALAGQLGLKNDQSVLLQCLDEEKRMDARLTGLAKGEINRAAMMTAA